MRFVNILRSRTAYIYQRKAATELGQSKKIKKVFTTTLYVVADSYDPFSGGQIRPLEKKFFQK